MKIEEKLDFDKVWQMFQETDAKFQETDKQITKLGKQIGGLGNSFGRYTEGIVGPSIRKIIQNQFGAEYVAANVERKINGKKYEIDFFGSSNGTTNKAFVVEVKTTLQDKHIEQLSKIVNKLHELMPEQKGKKIYGAIAAVSFTSQQKQIILDKGFYFINITNELAHLDVPKNFKPKAF